MRWTEREVDFCVVGGGLSGMCAAVAAARRGARVCLLHDRPVWGGNASSECRMWICGAHGPNRRETGLLEEIQLENLYHNPIPTYADWDAVLHSFILGAPRVEFLLNCAVMAGRMEDGRLVEVTGYESLSQTFHRVRARAFADCSGDSVLAAVTGAETRLGREAASEFGEDIAPQVADRRTMGNSCLIQAREYATPQSFTPPSWARKFTSEDEFPHRSPRLGEYANYWWMELGGEDDTIHDAAVLREKLLALAYGVWDWVKNRSDYRDEFAHWALDWVGFLPGKRESLRYVGDHILNQNDVRAAGPFDDIVAYGGWTMDDHHPSGFATREKPTTFHPAPSPFGIPYRSLYSRTVPNLYVAGRNISATHAALSSTRVMATCALMGQAIGTAAALGVQHDLDPRGVGQNRLRELQQALMFDDAWLPGLQREIAELSRAGEARLTASSGDPEPLRDGVDRPIDDVDHAWSGVPGKDWAAYEFDAPRAMAGVRLVFDSHLDRPLHNMPCHFPLNTPRRGPPETLVRDFRLEARDADGSWRTVLHYEGNYQRLLTCRFNVRADAVRIVPETTWGAPTARLFAFEVF